MWGNIFRGLRDYAWVFLRDHSASRDLAHLSKTSAASYTVFSMKCLFLFLPGMSILLIYSKSLFINSGYQSFYSYRCFKCVCLVWNWSFNYLPWQKVVKSFSYIFWYFKLLPSLFKFLLITQTFKDKINTRKYLSNHTARGILDFQTCIQICFMGDNEMKILDWKWI